ncbi:MAG: patatin-like phospholipase family protein [Candidatus Omnitrophica bacterium]|nr:patatin-like phospholipase family protein [Candidatus Omnitrophota bacterium]
MKDQDKKKIAFVFGGGSARGLAHIGVLRVLRQNNIPVDLVVGTSIGSLLAAICGLGLSLKSIENIADKMKWWDLADFVISKIGFLEGRNLEKLIKESIENKGFKDLKMPLGIVCTDIENGEEVVLTTGSLSRAIRASCSIPGIFMPVRIGGRLLVDGGLKSNVPSDVAKRMGASFVIAVDVGYCVKKGKISNIFQMVFQSTQIVGNELNKYEAKEADNVIKVHLSDEFDQMAFHRAKEIIAAGERAAKAAMGSLIMQLKEEGLM